MGARLGADTRTPSGSTACPAISAANAATFSKKTALAIEDGQITAIYNTRNPDKLRHVATGAPRWHRSLPRGHSDQGSGRPRVGLPDIQPLKMCPGRWRLKAITAEVAADCPLVFG